MPKQRSYQKRADVKGHIACDCKTAYAGSRFERANIGSNKQLKKSRYKGDESKIYPHSYKVEKGSKLSIGTFLNECKCTLFSGKARTSSIRTNRKNPSYVRHRTLKNVGGVTVRFT